MAIYQKQNLLIRGDSIKDISKYHSDLETLDCLRGIWDKLTQRLLSKLKESNSFFTMTRLGNGNWLICFLDKTNKNNPYYAILNQKTNELMTEIDIRVVAALLDADVEYTLYHDIDTNAFDKPGYDNIKGKMQEIADEYDRIN